MENVKTLVETGGGAMDSILQLTVYLTKIEDYDGMNKVFKTYFPNGGPARTTVAVAALPDRAAPPGRQATCPRRAPPRMQPLFSQELPASRAASWHGWCQNRT